MKGDKEFIKEVWRKGWLGSEDPGVRELEVWMENFQRKHPKEVARLFELMRERGILKSE